MPKAQGTLDPLGGCVGGSRPSQRAYTSLHENLVSNYSTMLQATLRPCNEVSNEVSIKVSNNPDGRGAMARESYSVGSSCFATSAMSRVLVTGANQGVGYLTCARLANEPSIGAITLACRNADKANEAVKQLIAETGKPDSFFSVVIVDLTSLASVRACVSAVTGPVDILLLNAGGIGGDDHLKLTPDGITKVCAMNATGSAALFEGLLGAKKLAPAAVVVYASSEVRVRGSNHCARVLCGCTSVLLLIRPPASPHFGRLPAACPRLATQPSLRRMMRRAYRRISWASLRAATSVGFLS